MNAQHGGPIGVPMASPTARTVQPMADMQAIRGPMAPTLLEPMHPNGMNGHAHAGMNGMLRPQMLTHDGMQPLPGVMPTTIPGQGPPVAPSQPQIMQYGYPSVGDMPLHINGGIPRDATSTALVQPVPYGSPMTAHQYSVAQPQPQISKRVKILLALALLMVVAAIATIAIIRGSSSSEAPKSAVAAKPETAQEAPEHARPGGSPHRRPEAGDDRAARDQNKLRQKNSTTRRTRRPERPEAKLSVEEAADDRRADAGREDGSARRAEQQQQPKSPKKKAEQKPEQKPEQKRNRGRRPRGRRETREPRTPVASSSRTTKRPDPSDVKGAHRPHRGKKSTCAKTMRAAVSRSPTPTLASCARCGGLEQAEGVQRRMGRRRSVGRVRSLAKAEPDRTPEYKPTR